MADFIHHAIIDYSVDDSTVIPLISYNGIRVTRGTNHNDQPVAVFSSGDPIFDHNCYIDWCLSLRGNAEQHGASVIMMETSSFDHWYQDIYGVKEVDGRMTLDPDD